MSDWLGMLTLSLNIKVEGSGRKQPIEWTEVMWIGNSSKVTCKHDQVVM